MGSYAEEDAFCNRMTNGKRNGVKPAFLKVLSDAESKPEPVRTFSDVNKSRYHGYSRWLTRRAKSLSSLNTTISMDKRKRIHWTQDDKKLLRSTSRKISRTPSLADILKDTYAHSKLKVYFSNIVGLRLADVPDHAVVCEQGRMICQEYIFNRLKKQNLLQHAGKAGPVVQAVLKPTDISSEIQTLGNELEKSYPELYTNVCKQLQVTLRSDTLVNKTFLAVAEHMVKNQQSITWGKVVALFALAGGFAQACVQQGHPEFIATVLNTFETILNKHLATWVVKQGGWVDIVRTFRTSSETPVLWLISIVGATVGFALTLLATTQL